MRKASGVVCKVVRWMIRKHCRSNLCLSQVSVFVRAAITAQWTRSLQNHTTIEIQLHSADCSNSSHRYLAVKDFLVNSVTGKWKRCRGWEQRLNKEMWCDMMRCDESESKTTGGIDNAAIHCWLPKPKRCKAVITDCMLTTSFLKAIIRSLFPFMTMYLTTLTLPVMDMHSYF